MWDGVNDNSFYCYTKDDLYRANPINNYNRACLGNSTHKKQEPAKKEVMK